MKKNTTYSRIIKLLSDSAWHGSNEICQPWIGGRQGISRICELRKLGVIIDDQKNPNGRGNEYKLIYLPKEQSVKLAVPVIQPKQLTLEINAEKRKMETRWF